MIKTLRELRGVPHFYQLFLARTISNFGNGISPVALAFGVLGLVGADAGSLSLVQVARTLPIILLLFVGGTLADKYGRARIMGLTDMWLSVLVLTIGISFIMGNASILLLVVMGILSGLLNGMWSPAFSGMIPLIVPKEKLQGANAALGFGSNIAFMIGTAAGGLIVSTIGPGWALSIDGLSFLIAGALVYPLRKIPQAGRVDNGVKISFAHELKLGWRDFISRSWLVSIVLAFSFINVTIEAVWAVLGAVQSQAAYDGATTWSWILGAMSIGFLLGTVIANKMRPKRPLVVLMLLMLADPLFLFVFGTSQPIWMVLITAVFLGIALDTFYVIWATVMQQNIPDETLSRVSSYDTFGSYLLGPIGMGIAGPLALIIGAQSTLLIGAALATVAILSPLFVSSVRRMRLTSGN